MIYFNKIDLYVILLFQWFCPFLQIHSKKCIVIGLKVNLNYNAKRLVNCNYYQYQL